MIIQDEVLRLIQHTRSARSACDGYCVKCTEDSRHFNSLEETMRRSYGGTPVNLRKYACPVALAMTNRIERLANEHPEYGYVRKFARKLGQDAFFAKGRRINLAAIKDDLVVLGAVLGNTKAMNSLADEIETVV